MNVIVWDVETVPDLRGFAAANGLSGKTEAEVLEAIGDKFPKHIYHSIVCIGALVAHSEQGAWVVDALSRGSTSAIHPMSCRRPISAARP